jgi:DNA polymerase-3 subunit epsilon
MNHQIEPVVTTKRVPEKGRKLGANVTETTYRCTVCHQTWKTAAPTSDCPGVPIYSWNPWPDGLFTKTQLAGQGFNPGPLAGVIPRAKDPTGWMKVYRLTEAIPKRKLSEAQAATLDKARSAAKAVRTCTRCHDVLPSKRYIRNGLCLDCRWLVRIESDRAAAVEWARQLLTTKFIILDLETTGLGSDAEIIQVATIDQAGQPLIDTYVKPLHPINETPYTKAWNEWGGYEYDRPTAYGVNGISNAMLFDAPAFPSVYEDLKLLLAGKTVITYNVAYDRSMLRDNCDTYALPPLEAASWLCAMEWYSQHAGDWNHRHKNYRYQSLPGATHSALADCQAVLALLRALASGTDPHQPELDHILNEVPANV